MSSEILFLRLLHILGGSFWVGSALFTTVFLVPALGSSGPDAARVMGALRDRKLFTVLPIIALVTIASGARLMSITSAGFSDAYLASASGRLYMASAAAAIVTFALSLLVSRPSMLRAAKLGAAMASAPEADRARMAAEAGRLRRRSTISSMVGTILIVLAAAGMATARYVR